MENKDSRNQIHSRWIDVSIPLRNGMVHWPGDSPFELSRIQDMERGDSVTLSRIAMGLHSGTHVDAPKHFIRKGEDVTLMRLDAMIGIARVIEIHDPHSIKPAELINHRIRRGERILFKTCNSTNAWKTDVFMKDYVFISKEAADYLSEIKIKVVGVDYLSVGAYKGDGPYVHRMLLGSGVWLIEGLDLSPVSPGKYSFICLPLRILGGDGAPARAVLRPTR